MNDLVSIIMPSYNTAKYIQETINTVLAQTYTHWELIIVDDCSNDNTEAVVQSYLLDNRIRYFMNEKNSGAAVSRNRALREASGSWIAFLDSDDLWECEKLEKQIAFMEKNKYFFSYTNYVEMDEKSLLNGKSVTGPKKITKRGMRLYCWMGCLTVMYSAKYIGVIQIENIKKNNDYAMWLKVSKKTNCYLLDENLARYRKRSGSISNHKYKDLIKWHYKLFKEAEKQSTMTALINTVNNLVFGLVKKIKYVKDSSI